MSPRQKVRLVFYSALILLVVCGIGAAASIANLVRSTKWVAHTYTVKDSLSKVDSALSVSGRLRATYIELPDPATRANFDSSVLEVQKDIHRVQELTSDNPAEQQNCAGLQTIADQRIANLTASVNAVAPTKPADVDQIIFSKTNLKLAAATSDALNRMQAEEDALLQRRIEVSDRYFHLSVGVLAVLFLISLILIAIHFRMLNIELGKREQSEENARHLSAKLLRLQDEERRRFSRELHDGLGQTLAVLKWTLTSLLEKNPDDAALAESVKSVDEAILGTRTISHLLHPPLLDEAGFDSAARWYVEGFSQRSGIPVKLVIADVGRLPRSVELVLFRVLQEALTNIHRHSKSPRAEVFLKSDKSNVVLTIRDFGAGIPEDTLESFRSKGTRVGVGLAGMRERVHEQGGEFEIHSSETGTSIEITLPRNAPTAIEKELSDTSIA